MARSEVDYICKTVLLSNQRTHGTFKTWSTAWDALIFLPDKWFRRGDPTLATQAIMYLLLVGLYTLSPLVTKLTDQCLLVLFSTQLQL